VRHGARVVLPDVPDALAIPQALAEIY
jgi:hypothetical protein